MELITVDKESAWYEQALQLRYTLFYEEHGLPWDILFDDLEDISYTPGIIEGELLLGYGRVTPIDQEIYTITQMVVHPRYQKKGIGTEILRELIRFARDHGARKIELNSRLNAIPLYQNQGFIQVGGTFPSKMTGVDHVQMELIITR